MAQLVHFCCYIIDTQMCFNGAQWGDFDAVIPVVGANVDSCQPKPTVYQMSSFPFL